MISLCHININSVIKHKNELEARFSKYDIISVNETNLKRKRKFSLMGYNVFRNDRDESNGGGVLLAVKTNIKCREIINKTTNDNEVIAVEIETNRFGSILISSIYVPPRVKLDLDVFRELHNCNNNCIIVGDLNARLSVMGSRETNTKGKQLLALLNEGFIECIDDDYTSFDRDDYEEKLDWILASQPLKTYITNVETHATIGTRVGHKPLTFDINLGAESKSASPRLSFNFNAARWFEFRNTLNQQLSKWNDDRPLDTPQAIEEYNSFITNCLMTASKQAIPLSKQLNTSPVISEASKNLIALKHQTYRRWKKSSKENDKRQFYRAKDLLTNSLRNDKRNSFIKLMSTLCQNRMYSNAVWRTVRKFHNKRVKQSSASSLNYKGKAATKDKEKADLFAEYFENEVYANCQDSLPFHKQVTRQANKIKEQKITRPITSKWELISELEVKQHIKVLRNSSAGPDNVHNRCLKNYTDSLIKHLTKLFNHVLILGYIPNEWKKAYIILLLKPNKDKNQPSSYRPISLLSCLGKLLEKIIKKRLMLVLNRRNILPQHQAGFRPGKSTLYNILRLERHAEQNLILPMSRIRRHSAVILFDIKAAFDSVWHDGLIYKLNDLRIPRYLVNYMISFLNDRTAYIELENILSRPFKLCSGTPQGSPLSPLLYIIYTADSMNGIPPHTEHGLFADDTALWTASTKTKALSSRLQQSIDAFESWCKSWKLRLQPTKTELIHFKKNPRKKLKHPVAVKVDNTEVKPLEHTRYLGVIFDQQLKWKSHLEHIERRIAPRICLLRYLSKAAKEPNNTTMINLYKSMIRSILVYGSPAILKADQTVWDRLQVMQNKALRAALGLPSYTSVDYLHKFSNIPRIKDYAIEQLHKSIQRATLNNDNTMKEHLQQVLEKI